MGCVDDVIREPDGGTQQDPALAMQLVSEQLAQHLYDLQQLSLADLLAARHAKFRNIAQFFTAV